MSAELCLTCMNARVLENAEGARMPCPGCDRALSHLTPEQQAIAMDAAIDAFERYRRVQVRVSRAENEGKRK